MCLLEIRRIIQSLFSFLRFTETRLLKVAYVAAPINLAFVTYVLLAVHQ